MATLRMLFALFFATAASLKAPTSRLHPTWAPQDLTRDNAGFAPIPEDDYVKQYERNQALWPVEFFVIVYRRIRDGTAEVLVRRSANGTSKYGVGTGAPATRWILSSQEAPRGYAKTGLSFAASTCVEINQCVRSASPNLISTQASNFPEFDADVDWTYDKIDIRADAFAGDDLELEAFAGEIRDGLIEHLAARAGTDAWEQSTLSVVRRVLDKPNALAAIQGTLRMSGVFSRKATGGRYVDPADAAGLAESVRIYTMFPQMPSPMPAPTATPDELRQEMDTRAERMRQSGRDPHTDRHGRVYTHISTPNVSNTIHGVYLTLDATGLLDDIPPALDLFGTKEVEREWVSLQDLEVLDSVSDPKPTFISGFIVRQLVAEGVIDVRR